MFLALLACAPPPEPSPGVDPADPETMEWLYGSVEPLPDDQLVGTIWVDHNAWISGPEASFSAGAGLLAEPLSITQPWSDPFEGLGDCGVWSESPTLEGEPRPVSAGTIFLDAGLDEPLPLAPIDNDYPEAYFSDLGWGPVPFGAVFAVAAVGADYPSFDWDPALVLPAAPMIVTSPVTSDNSEASVSAGALPLTWQGAEPLATVRIEISGGGVGAYCEVPDTGAFTVPAATMAAIPSSGGRGRLSLHVTRSLERFEALEPDRYVSLQTRTSALLFLRVE